MSSRPVAIRNVTSVEQYVLVDSRRYSVGPYQTRVYEENIARAFLDRCAPRVVREGGINSADEDKPRYDKVYLYNLSGDPDAPAEVRAVIAKGGKTVTENIPNPLREPVTVKRSLGGSEENVQIGQEASVRRGASREITVHPWTRKSFEKPEADWMLNREGMRSLLTRTIARSRPPTNFEPDESWELDNILVYASIIDPKCKRVPTEKVLRGKAEKVHTRKTLADQHGAAFGEVRSGDEAVDVAKDIMLKRLYFRLANPMFTLPNREEFQSHRDSILTSWDVDTKVASREAKDVGKLDLETAVGLLSDDEESNHVHPGSR